MASPSTVTLRVSANSLEKYEHKLKEMVRRMKDRRAFFQRAGAYMVRSTQNRLLRTKRQPDGERMKALSPVTIALKGSSSILFDGGELSRGITVNNISSSGFTLKAEAINDRGQDYARFMQSGVRRGNGFIKTSRRGMFVPARPYMGFSEANVKRLSKMLQEHIFGETLEESVTVE